MLPGFGNPSEEPQLLDTSILDSPPAIFNHCVNAYKLMFDRSNQHSDGMVVYEGFLVRLFTKDLSLSTPYYSYCVNLLKKMGCIQQIKRGGGSSPSQWQLIRQPTRQLFHDSADAEDDWNSTARQKKNLKSNEQVRHEVGVLRKEVVDLREQVEKLTRAVISVGSRKCDCHEEKQEVQD